MDLVWNILLFCFGIGLLVKGADWLVDSAARVAKQFGVSNFIIGLTIVALGTSLPEFATAVTASLYQNSSLVLGNIIGSNIANIALILGLAGIFVPIVVKKDIYNRDGTIMLVTTLLFFAFCLDGLVTAAEGGIFLFAFIAYLGFFVLEKRPYRKAFHFRRYLREYSDLKKRQRFDSAPKITKSVGSAFHHLLVKKPVSLLCGFGSWTKRASQTVDSGKKKIAKEKYALLFFFKQLAIFFFGVACIFFGARFVVTSSMQFPINQIVVGLIFIAIGTSLPELSVTISSLRKGLPDIMIGNIIGSNIANILLVGGVSAMISPIAVLPSVLFMDFIFLILVTWMFLVFLRNDYKIAGIESLTLFLFYVLFIATIFGLRVGA